MAEKRKPEFIFLLRSEKIGVPVRKSQKIELFDSRLWAQTGSFKKRYRLRVNGKWYVDPVQKEKFTFLSKWQVRDILWRSIKL